MGLALAVIRTRWLEGVLFAVSPTDPVTLLLVTIALLAVALLGARTMGIASGSGSGAAQRGVSPRR